MTIDQVWLLRPSREAPNCKLPRRSSQRFSIIDDFFIFSLIGSWWMTMFLCCALLSPSVDWSLHPERPLNIVSSKVSMRRENMYQHQSTRGDNNHCKNYPAHYQKDNVTLQFGRKDICNNKCHITVVTMWRNTISNLVQYHPTKYTLRHLDCG